jgi:D-lactate dehydrogenase (cytochrome)
LPWRTGFNFLPMISEADLKNLGDAGNAVFPPLGSDITTFFPETEEELSELFRLAASGNIPVTIVAAMTGLTGAAVPQESGWRIDTSRYVHLPDRPGYRRAAPFLLIDETDPHRGIVAPGVPLRELNQVLREQGLWYPPHPGETRALIGGNVATNASGSRTFSFGATREYVTSLRVVLATGDILSLQRGRERVTRGNFLVHTIGGWPLAGRVPDYQMSPVKNASGLFTAPDMDLIDLFIGSEGILGAFSEIGLRFLARRDLRSEIFFFPSNEVALDFTDGLRSLKANAQRYPSPDSEGAFGVISLEYLDLNALRLARESGHAVPGSAKAAIEVEAFAGDTFTIVKVAGLAEALGCVGVVPPDATSPFRYSVPRRVAELLKERGRPKVGTDFAIPLPSFREMFHLYAEKAKEFTAGREGIHTATWGHIGDCHLHVNFLCESEEDLQKVATIYLELVRKAVSLGGAISAEHGVGKRALTDEQGLRRPYLWYQFGEKYKQIGEVKKVFDPQGLLNKGNMGV